MYPMAYGLTTPVTQLHHLAGKLEKPLRTLGIQTIRDLIFYYPTRYDDYSVVLDIAALVPGTVATVRGRVEHIRSSRSPRRRLLITEAIVADGTGSVRVRWYNQPFTTRMFKSGDEVFVSGRVDSDHGHTFVSPSCEKITQPKQGGDTLHTARLVPVYHLTRGITTKQVRFLVKHTLDHALLPPEHLPPGVLQSHRWPALGQALQEIHFPTNQTTLTVARERLTFDELFTLQLGNRLAREARVRERAPQFPFPKDTIQTFVRQLPFTLTPGQRRAAWEAMQDLAKPYPMNRLLEGDVGSGKTAVAALVARVVVAGGGQVSYMAPTSILAVQHFSTLRRLCEGSGLRLGLYTRERIELGGLGTVGKKEFQKLLTAGEVDLVIGTHALLGESLRWHRLGLVIIDEQHRFGVSQRQQLQQSVTGSNEQPHLLSMTATPIPRSLALTLYGDLDLSVIRERPAGRRPIITEIVTPDRRGRMEERMQSELAAGRQCFVICPTIDESDHLGVRSVTAEYERLQTEAFATVPIGLLHGRLSADKREAARTAFLNGETKILVATSVVEVGVDVPNATVMVIEGSERFGLAQLHQFRGRVGRASHQSYCFLCTDTDTEGGQARLEAVQQSADGFALAEQDLRLRGPGELLGTSQSGVPDLKLANIFDYQLIRQAQILAEEVVTADPTLTHHPQLRELVGELPSVHLE